MGLTCYNNFVKINSCTFVDSNPELVLSSVFGYKNFRPLQEAVINSVLAKKDTLVIMPTGGGKSLCYQIPALILKGITIVVSPLISLMSNQVASLEKHGIHSVFLNSSLEWKEYLKAVDEIKKGFVKIIYVSPEGLATSRIRDLLNEGNLEVSCITIDEAHCVSEWGHDFRPDYMEIFSVRKLFPKATMIALTATATEQVKRDIIKNLGLKKPEIFTTSFDRKNIFLEVQPKKSGESQVIDFLKNHKDESGIIYCTSRRQVDELFVSLKKKGYSVLNYHAGLPDDVRGEHQQLFIEDKVKIIVATVAFGMGIDKPNVRFVINFDLPKSIEEYYQEIGRAGRDGQPAWALLLYTYADVHKIRYFFTDMADPTKAEMKLKSMVNFASGNTCRRKALLNYFGEKYEATTGEADGSWCCDICSNLREAKPLTDMTIPIQKFLCCILRTKSRFGAAYVIDVLLGSHNKRILENGHNMISTFSIGHELTKDDWHDLVDLLLEKEYIQRVGEYNVLELTDKGRDLLVTREKVLLPFVIHEKSKIKALPKQGKSSKAKFIVHKKH
ncbi:MAG: ATP-dependent DNA helicase RecQ [Spirochaetaceae bacterium]|nr:ATP-dependent DNA helicase RecQ [Spirochaetaceae bacterium]